MATDSRVMRPKKTGKGNDAEPVFFSGPAAFRSWLTKNHAKKRELHVGYYKKHTGRPSLTWPESVAEALCFGWIDGIRQSLDADRYKIRFTPRRKGSKWSEVNLRLVKELEAAGKMKPAGRSVWAIRVVAKSAGYSYERENARLDDARVRQFKKAKRAWSYFEALPPGYRQKVTWWVMSAKKEDARDRRFAKLFASCVEGIRLF